MAPAKGLRLLCLPIVPCPWAGVHTFGIMKERGHDLTSRVVGKGLELQGGAMRCWSDLALRRVGRLRYRLRWMVSARLLNSGQDDHEAWQILAEADLSAATLPPSELGNQFSGRFSLPL